VRDLYRDQAWLYDIAFDWDVTDEVDWLLDRLGPGCGSVLEPGCGSGRMLCELAGRGVEVAGIDLSAVMVDRAHARLRAATLTGAVTVADMSSFDLHRRFDGAICPVNTLAYLGEEALTATWPALLVTSNPARGT
jgi:cyclopropane fatty-acyl-phospholipid synthase-like methyltransferase